MKITEILVESQQVDEGPLLNKIGAGIGKAAGTVAKGIGAVAGGVVGAGKALAKGYQAGKATVGGAGDDTEADPATDGAAGGGAAPATTKPAAITKPAAGGGAPAATTQPAAGGGAPAAAPGGAPAATTKPAAAPAKPAADPAAGGTQYAQVKANIDKLDKKGKQRILQLLQKEVGSAPAAPAKTPAADPGAGAMGNMAGQLAKGGAAEPNTMANAPVSKTNTAKPGNPNAAPAAPKGNYDGNTGEPISDKGRADAASAAAFNASPKGQALKAKWDAEDAAAAGQAPAAEPVTAPVKQRTGGRVKGQLSQDPRAVKRREANAAKQQATEPKKKPAAPDQATIDAERERIMGPTSDSIIRTRPLMAEGFSLFRKR